MQIINKKYFKICVIVIFISLIIGYLFLLNKGNNIQKDNITYNDKMFAYMLEECNGSNCEYKESKTKAWPNVGYVYNSSLSMCIDAEGNSLTGILSYDNRLNVAKLTNTKSSTYCVLYFDKDNQKPVIKDFYVNNSDGYVAGKDVSGYVTWEDEDVVSYCISTTNNASSCVWKDATGKRAEFTFDIGNGAGDKTLYAFVKDTANNVSDSKSYKVTQDATKPTIKSFSLNNIDGFTNNKQDAGSITWDDNDVTKYCINTINNSSSCTWKDASGKKIDFTYDLGSQGEKTLYAFLKDKGGLISDSKSVKITLDTEGPVVTIVKSQGYESGEITLTLNITDNYSGIKSYTINKQGTSNTTSQNVPTYSRSLTNQTLSISVSSTGNHTVEAYAIDRLGNKGPVVTTTANVPESCTCCPSWACPDGSTHSAGHCPTAYDWNTRGCYWTGSCSC